MAETLGMGAAVAMISAPAKAATLVSASREAISNPRGFGSYIKHKFAPQGRFNIPPPMRPPPNYSNKAPQNQKMNEKSK